MASDLKIGDLVLFEPSEAVEPFGVVVWSVDPCLVILKELLEVRVNEGSHMGEVRSKERWHFGNVGESGEISDSYARLWKLFECLGQVAAG